MSKCKKCGVQLKETKEFCPNCGTKIEETQAVGDAVETFSFFKGKMLGNLTYKKTKTEMRVLDGQISMKQTLNRIFRKERVTEKSFAISSITSVKIHTVMDFWDTLFMIVFVILGFFQLAAFLMALVCLWCAYGKEMEITLSDGEKVKIPFSGAKAEMGHFLELCNK